MYNNFQQRTTAFNGSSDFQQCIATFNGIFLLVIYVFNYTSFMWFISFKHVANSFKHVTNSFKHVV